MLLRYRILIKKKIQIKYKKGWGSMIESHPFFVFLHHEKDF